MSIHAAVTQLAAMQHKVRDLAKQLDTAEQSYETLKDAFAAKYAPRYGSDGQIIAGHSCIVVGNKMVEFSPPLFDDDRASIRIIDVEVVQSGAIALPAPSCI